MDKRLISAALLSSILGLYSCQLEEYEVSTDETYTRAFIKQFGVIDSNQDWNMATRSNVVVTSSTPRDIRVYADIDGKYKFVGDKLGLNGTDTIWFDVPKGVSNILVSDDCYGIETQVGQTVNFTSNATRAINLDTNDGGTSTTDSETGYTTKTLHNVSVSETGTYITFDYSEATGWEATLPEEEENTGNLTDNYHFYYSKTTVLYIYPVFWNTGATDVTVGVCRKDDSGTILHVPVYSIKSGNELQYSKSTTKTYTCDELKAVSGLEWKSNTTEPTGTQLATIKEYLTRNGGEWESVSSISAESNSSDDSNTTYSVSVTGNIWMEITGNVTKLDANGNKVYKDGKEVKLISSKDEALQEGGSDCKFRTRAIKVEIPANVLFAFYIQQKYTDSNNTVQTKTFYSKADWNEGNLSYSATAGNDEGWREIAFEDWNNKKHDLNDVILAFMRPESSYNIVDDDPNTWLLAAEDLGDMDDFDFNDMVLSVSAAISNTTTGNKEVTLKAMAAGGTLPLYIYRNGESLTLYETDGTTEVGSSDSDGLEFHKWFGTSHESTEMINTSSYSVTGKSYKIILESDDTFTMGGTTTDNKSIATSNTDKMGGFSIKVKRSDGTSNTVTAPYKGKAPQMICMPWSWQWPKERIRIDDAYNGFKEWCEDNTKTDWYTTEGNSNTDKIVERYND